MVSRSSLGSNGPLCLFLFSQQKQKTHILTYVVIRFFLRGLSGGMLDSWFNDKLSITIHLPYQNLKHNVKWYYKLKTQRFLIWLSFLKDSGISPQVQKSSHSNSVEISVSKKNIEFKVKNIQPGVWLCPSFLQLTSTGRRFF